MAAGDSPNWVLRMQCTEDGQLRLPVQGSSGGINIGGDVNVYRDSANTLRLQNNLIVEQNLWANTYGSDNFGVSQEGLISAKGYTNTATSLTSPSRSINSIYQNTTGKTLIVYITVGLTGVGQPFYTHTYLKMGSSSPPSTVVAAASNPVNSEWQSMIAIVPANWYYKLECDQSESFCWIYSWQEQTL